MSTSAMNTAAMIEEHSLERNDDCEHDASGEACLMAHYMAGILQKPCRRCIKCGSWVPLRDIPRDCNDCGAKPGEFHEPGCYIERCSLCGHQRIGCECVWEVNGIDWTSLEEEHPDWYENGPTEAHYAVFDAEVERLGGRLPWTGVYPGLDACRELGLWCRDEPGQMHVPCEATDPGAHEDLNRLHAFAYWDPVARRWKHNSWRDVAFSEPSQAERWLEHPKPELPPLFLSKPPPPPAPRPLPVPSFIAPELGLTEKKP